jgi:uncharacterized protein (TIGR02391 family)
MAPEEVAAVMLRLMIRQYNEAASRPGAHRPERFHIGNFCNAENAMYEQHGQPGCLESLAAGWNHLVVTGMLVPDPENQGMWHLLTRRARAINSDADYEHFRKISLYPKGSIDRLIEAETYAEFLRGDYETAVFKAFKAIEVRTRRACDLDDTVIGKDVMIKAFRVGTGILTDTDEVPAEQESLQQLFTGAIGRFKNPGSHREVNITDPVEAIEMIQLASLLMRIVWRRHMDREGLGNLDAAE